MEIPALYYICQATDTGSEMAFSAFRSMNASLSARNLLWHSIGKP